MQANLRVIQLHAAAIQACGETNSTMPSPEDEVAKEHRKKAKKQRQKDNKKLALAAARTGSEEPSTPASACSSSSVLDTEAQETAESFSMELPRQFECPVSLELMVDPGALCIMSMCRCRMTV